MQDFGVLVVTFSSVRLETTITAAELCTCGMWERVDGGYRILDWERENGAKIQAHMAKPILVTSPCAVCGTPATRVELVAPGQLPAEWEQWPSTVQASIVRQPEPGQWYLLVKGIAMYNGFGDPFDATRAGQIAWAFRPPLCFAQVHTAGFYDDAGFCPDCDAPYCYRYWHVSESGVRLLPPRSRQEPGLALVAAGNRPDVNRTGDPLGVNERQEG